MRIIHRIGYVFSCIGLRLLMVGRVRASEQRDEMGVDASVTYAGP